MSATPLAEEFVVYLVKRSDNESEWNPRMNNFIYHESNLHHSKVALILGNTAWIYPMVWVTSLSSMKVWLNEYNIPPEILSTGLVTDNHVTEFRNCADTSRY